MDLIFDTPVEDIIKERCSVRTYREESVPEELKKKINDHIVGLSNPFHVRVSFRSLEAEVGANAPKLGTYGVIKGAGNYIGASLKEEELALEGLGYEFEKLILYITSLGMGTCWLGGTFKREEFAEAMSLEEEELFPVVSPFGFAADKKSFTELAMRFVAKSDKRKDWSELFFKDNFSTALSKSEAGRYQDPLEMLRLGPSASNKQPWRVVKEENLYHFYEKQSPGYSKAFRYDIQRIEWELPPVISI